MSIDAVDRYLAGVGARRLAPGEWGLTIAADAPAGSDAGGGAGPDAGGRSGSDAGGRSGSDAGGGAGSDAGGRSGSDAGGAGHPLDIGIRAADGLVRIQAFAVPAADAPASEDVLHWNRATRIVRFARTRDGDVWVQADLVLASAGEEIDRVLGLVVEAARAARAAAYAPPAAGGGWLSGG